MGCLKVCIKSCDDEEDDYYDDNVTYNDKFLNLKYLILQYLLKSKYRYNFFSNA